MTQVWKAQWWHWGWHWHRVQRWARGPSFTCCHRVCLACISPISLSTVRPLCWALWWPRENSSSWTPALPQGPNPAKHSQGCAQLSLPLLSPVSIDTAVGGTVPRTNLSLCKRAHPVTVWVWSAYKFRNTEEKNSHNLSISKSAFLRNMPVVLSKGQFGMWDAFASLDTFRHEHTFFYMKRAVSIFW